MKFYIETLGCKVNHYESNFIKENLIKEGFFEVENINEADVSILNTCSVTNTSDTKCLKRARHIRKENPNGIFIVCGCSTQNDKDRYKEIKIDIILGTKDKTKIPNLIKEYIKTDSPYENICNPKEFAFENMEISTFDQIRAYIKIQDGCDNYCSYCIIPYVRGNIRFKEYTSVIQEVKKLASNGYQEIVLTGIHTGSYPNLHTLINDITNIPGIKRVRLSSIEITELDNNFLNLLKTNNIICDNLHIPLQAGSDVVLKRMNRKYNTKYFEEKINEIRTIRNDIYISTDVIVGHPCETKELFEETLDFCKKIKFSKIHVFPYSDRNGTAASRMDNHVDQKDIKIWSKKLSDLSKELENNYKEKFIGETFEVLIEDEKESYSVGHTSNFLKIKCPKNKINTFTNIKIDKENVI